jgi:hypothetical protein
MTAKRGAWMDAGPRLAASDPASFVSVERERSQSDAGRRGAHARGRTAPRSACGRETNDLALP